MKSIEEQQEKQYFIEYLRVIACIAVVLIHTCYIGYQSNHMPYEVELEKRMIYMVVNNLCLFAVPIFLMISGYLFLNPEKDIPIRKMYGKYVTRILGCLVMFGIPFSILENVFETRTLSIQVIVSAVRDVCTGQTWAHMWYLYTILGIYMVTPVIKYVIKYVHPYILDTVLLILFIYSMLGKCSPFVGIGLLYYLVGWKLRTVELSKRIRWSLYIMGMLAVGANIGYSIYCLKYYNQEISILADYDTWSTFFMALALFVSFKYGKVTNRPLKPLWSRIAEYSFGIYLIHPLFINLAYKAFKIYPMKYVEWVTIPLFGGTFFIMSFISTKLMRSGLAFSKRYMQYWCDGRKR